MLYISLYFKTHRSYYYELLNEVRFSGNWEAWLEFFAEAAAFTAEQAVETTRQLLDLSERDREKIAGFGRAETSALKIHRALMKSAVATSAMLARETGLPAATVNKTLDKLAKSGIVREITGKRRRRIFAYADYIEIMSKGTELPCG
jgi:Fic family protein